MQDALADEREVRLAVIVERDELAVEDCATGSCARKLARSVMSQPRRLRTRSDPSVETIARKPSHFTS